MKKMNLIAVLVCAFSASAVFASGSTDYLCAAQNSNIRYFFDDGEAGVSATVSRVTGINMIEAQKNIVKTNALNLDPFDIDNVLIKSHQVTMKGCDRQDFSEDKDYNDCLKQKGFIAVVSKQTVEMGPGGSKYNHITQTVDSGANMKVELDIKSYPGERDDGAYSGTLKITSNFLAYKAETATLKVQCMVTTP